jgi:putative membrane protein
MNNTEPSQTLSPTDNATRLAISRTRLAADRTLMSWIRTSLALISFGFTIIKFFEYLKFIALSNIKIPTTGITHLGISLILLGILSLIPAMIEYKKEMHFLKNIDGVTRKSYIVIVGYCVGLIGLYTLGNVLKLIFS